jgi:hypothetical protein
VPFARSQPQRLHGPESWAEYINLSSLSQGQKPSWLCSPSISGPKPQRAERTKADVGLVGGPNMRYLEAENEYCQRALADTKKLQENSNLVPK